MTGMPPLRDLTVGPDPLALLDPLRRALDGSGPAGRPVLGAAAARHDHDTDHGLPDGLALVVSTSGSSGVPKQTMLTADALIASADATHEVLGGPGRWLLALPVDHIAGVQVLVRSLRAGTTPVAMDATSGFRASDFRHAAQATLDGPGPAYTALVPTQLGRVLRDPEATRTLARFHAVLVGGARTPPELAGSAAAAGVRLVRTYGMSETSGGCVYDGRPLPVTQVRLGGDGRVLLGGRTLASGYLGDPERTAAAFVTDPDGSTWFRTDDLGRWAGDGRLEVLGRADAAILTGGHTVDPERVRAAVLDLTGAADALVVGLEDPEWGQVVGLLVSWTDPADALRLPALRDLLRARLAGHELPRVLRAVAGIPLTGLGKPDRTGAAALLADSETIERYTPVRHEEG